MASATTSYNMQAEDAGQPEKTDDSGNPLVSVLIKAMKTAQANADQVMAGDNDGSLSGILNQPWAKGFEDQIKNAYATVAPQGGLVDTKA